MATFLITIDHFSIFFQTSFVCCRPRPRPRCRRLRWLVCNRMMLASYVFGHSLKVKMQQSMLIQQKFGTRLLERHGLHSLDHPPLDGSICLVWTSSCIQSWKNWFGMLPPPKMQSWPPGWFSTLLGASQTDAKSFASFDTWGDSVECRDRMACIFPLLQLEGFPCCLRFCTLGNDKSDRNPKGRWLRVNYPPTNYLIFWA